MNKIKKIVQHLPTTWYNAFFLKNHYAPLYCYVIISLTTYEQNTCTPSLSLYFAVKWEKSVRHCMARQWKLHTALILQGKIDVPRNVRQFRAVKASGYLVLPTFVNCDLDRVFPYRIGGNVPVKVESWKVKILEISMQFKNNPWTKELNYVKNPSHSSITLDMNHEGENPAW